MWNSFTPWYLNLSSSTLMVPPFVCDCTRISTQLPSEPVNTSSPCSFYCLVAAAEIAMNLINEELSLSCRHCSSSLRVKDNERTESNTNRRIADVFLSWHLNYSCKALFTRNVCVNVNVNINFNILFMVTQTQKQRMSLDLFSAFVFASLLAQCRIWRKRRRKSMNGLEDSPDFKIKFFLEKGNVFRYQS